MNLTEQDYHRLTEFYRRSLVAHGSEDAKALHWLSKRDQLTRFDILTQIADLSGHSILDVGSGVGDLYDFLQLRFNNFDYTGLDIVPEMTEQARAKFPQARFITGDIFNINRHYDYLIASGSLTFNVDCGRQFYYRMISHMYHLANLGVAFNVLDSFYHSTDRDYLAYNKDEVSEVCQKITPNYKIITGYELGDFAVFLHKSNGISTATDIE